MHGQCKWMAHVKILPYTHACNDSAHQNHPIIKLCTWSSKINSARYVVAIIVIPKIIRSCLQYTPYNEDHTSRHDG